MVESSAALFPIHYFFLVEACGQPLTGDKIDEEGLKGMLAQREMMWMIFGMSS
jgi:hypothetical protein